MAKLAAMALEVVTGGLQAMVHMQRPHLPRPVVPRGQQQGGGVGTAAQGHRHGCAK
jgi:hypothetical protein